MRKSTPPHWQIADLSFSVFIFFILVLYTYGILFKAPYSGFYFGSDDGQISDVYDTEQEPSLQPGDIIVRIGEVSWADYKKDGRVSFFKNNKAGDILDIVVIRNGIELTIPWKFTGFTKEQFNTRFFNIWGLAYIFWFFGSLGQLLIRPKDIRWRLFISANYLTALWLIFGSMSAWHIWESSILLRVITWLLLPVYLHLHWVFPRPFRELPKMAWALFYAACLIFAIAEVTQSLPRNLYTLAFLIALVGSIALEITHYIQQADYRRDVLLLIFSILIAFVPSIGLGILAMVGKIPFLGPAALFSLPFMPLSYFYVIYRHQLGGLEVRVNRLISFYGFMILFGTIVSMLVVLLASLNLHIEEWILLVTVLLLVTVIIGITTFPMFQSLVEKVFFGIKLPYQNLQEAFSNRITSSTSLSCLLQILEDEVFPSLLVRQYAFTQASNGELKVLLAKNVNLEDLPNEDGMEKLISPVGTSPTNGWIRLVLPLKAGDRSIGFWLLGQRDPDDHYPQEEIPILQSLANQTAIALSNILHSEQLRKMYQSDIERNEKERMRLALELHDSILNELAVLRTSLSESSLPPQFQISYEEVTSHLREIVRDLRPPMLMYGLVPAINELADNLMERSGDKVLIKVEIQAGEERLPQNMEQHLFRITQEACENSMRHAQPKNIVIFGALASQHLDLTIEDDGKGFEPQLDMGNLIANNHFGLAGMLERALLIGAEIDVQSSPNTGTKINIRWSNHSDGN